MRLTIATTTAAVWLLAFGAPSSARADIDHDPQVWTAALGSAPLGSRDSKLALWLDVHVRRSDAGLVHIARPAVGYRALGWLSVWAGYAWVPFVPDDGDTVHEHRLWQQVIARASFGQLSLQSRTRFEQRLSSAGDDLGLRVREFVRASWSPEPGSTIGLVVWDELFVGLNEPDWGARSGLDQNRLFAGPWFKVRDQLRLEVGYLLLYAERGTTDTLGHVLATNLFVTL